MCFDSMKQKMPGFEQIRTMDDASEYSINLEFEGVLTPAAVLCSSML